MWDLERAASVVESAGKPGIAMVIRMAIADLEFADQKIERLEAEIDAMRGALATDETQRLMAEAVLREQEIELLKDRIADFQATIGLQTEEIEGMTAELDEARKAAREIYRDGTSLLSFAERWPWLETDE